MTKERPILFNTEMVQAILDGRKTMTRRVVKPQPDESATHFEFNPEAWPKKPWLSKYKYALPHERWEITNHYKCPYGKIGDVLWVRETIMYDENGKIFYKADHNGFYCFNWTPSIHMPRAACRIRLEITDIRVERLQEISKGDAVAEGVETLGLYPGYDISSRGKFEGLWSKINGTESWNSNPFLWVITFKKL